MNKWLGRIFLIILILFQVSCTTSKNVANISESEVVSTSDVQIVSTDIAIKMVSDIIDNPEKIAIPLFGNTFHFKFPYAVTSEEQKKVIIDLLSEINLLSFEEYDSSNQ